MAEGPIPPRRGGAVWPLSSSSQAPWDRVRGLWRGELQCRELDDWLQAERELEAVQQCRRI
jgi:hypothetical protein